MGGADQRAPRFQGSNTTQPVGGAGGKNLSSKAPANDMDSSWQLDESVGSGQHGEE